MMSDMNDLNTGEYVVAFIDILGASKMIIEKKDVMKTIHIVYKNAIQRSNEMMEYFKSSEIKLKIFSDNIIVAMSIDNKMLSYEEKFENLAILTLFVEFLQHEFALNDILLRGGITIGELSINDVFVWGEALLRAHYLENSIAIYPRVILDHKLVEYLGGAEFIKKKIQENNWIAPHLEEDIDNYFYIDYINLYIVEEEHYPRIVASLCKMNEDNITNEGNDLKILQKLIWQQRYTSVKLAQAIEVSGISQDEFIKTHILENTNANEK